MEYVQNLQASFEKKDVETLPPFQWRITYRKSARTSGFRNEIGNFVTIFPFEELYNTFER